MTMPTWLTNDLAVKWCGTGGWEKPETLRLREDESAGGGSYSAESAGGAIFKLTVRTETGDPGNGATSVWELTANTGPGERFRGLQLMLPLDYRLKCVWKPHLSPMEDMVVGDKSFRSPAMIAENPEFMAALIPDLDHLNGNRTVPHIMDYTLKDHSFMYGLGHYQETGHVYYQLAPESTTGEQNQYRLRFYTVSWTKPAGSAPRDLRPVEQFLWRRFASARMEHEPSVRELEKYAVHTYGWALDRWNDVAWQEFRLNGEEVGGVVFIVTAKQKPGGGREEQWREPKSLWNQAWFCSLRSAYGYWLWGRQWGRGDYCAKAEKALAFALSAPQTNGLFPAYYQADEQNRWEGGRWVNSAPRRPEGHEEFVHLLDASWTCFWLLKWYRDIRRDDRILSFVRRYAGTLLSLQQPDGSFPAWVRPDTMEASPYLMESPESAAHIQFLALLHEIEPDTRITEAAEKAAAFIIRRILPEGRWEDFETYWSCARQWEGKRYGEADRRSGLYSQCNFGMYWSAEGLKEAYRMTGRRSFLEAGERVLAELSLYQQIWEPAWLPVPAVGGFGVMNCDDEWNDARQSLFASTYMDYYRLTGNESYRKRGKWAMQASFYMMYCPENPEVRRLYEQVHPHFDERDFGFHMENFNHHDGTSIGGLGEFTIFDWGNGAASTALAEFLAKYGDEV